MVTKERALVTMEVQQQQQGQGAAAAAAAATSSFSSSPLLRRETKKKQDKSSFVIDDLLNSMNLADQIGQMSQIDIGLLLLDDNDNKPTALDPKKVERYIGEMGIGSILNAVFDDNSDKGGKMWTARQYRETMIYINQIADKYNRPPVLWGLDSVHGANYIKDAIITPQPLNLAATFNVTMSYIAGKLASRDTRAAGIQWLFSPLLGLGNLHSMWSRIYETYGEDPYLVGEMANSMIHGIQEVESNGVIPSRAAACGKHFVGYSAPQTGHDRSPSWIPTRHLYQYFIPPWRKVVQEVATIMESYTEIDGIPIVANHELLDELLRHRLNFTGVLVTDYEEIRNLHQWHHVTPTYESAIVKSLQEGTVDMSMIPWEADEFATSIVNGISKSKTLTHDRIQTSARRILQLKHEFLQMWDETITIVDDDLDLVGNKDDPLNNNVQQIVEDSLILTKNVNDVLPLLEDGTTSSKKKLKVHVTGPTANSLQSQTGGWTGQWQGMPDDSWFSYGSTVWDAVQNEKQSWQVTYTCGVNILGRECDDPDELVPDENIIDQFKHWTGLTPTTSMAKSVQAAKNADITIICVGEESYTEKPGDIRSLELPTGQNDLVHAIRRNVDDDSNHQIILVYFGGRPRLLRDMVDQVDAVLLAFLPGPNAGQAIVDVLTGRVNPNGRLPITYPLYQDGGGVPYWHAVTDQCTHGEEGTTLPHYEYVPCQVQWPFGHGLSYTTFTYSDLSAVGGIDDDLQIKVTVTNTGSRTGAETVLFFTFDEFRIVTPEYKRLRAFEKVLLDPGQSITITKTVPVEELRFVGPHDDKHYILDPHMISYLGVGSDTDCRRRDDKTNPDEDDLCVRLASKAPDRVYKPACEAACNLWKTSGCMADFGIASYKDCESMCVSVEKMDGWGWNYVNCIEPIIWSMCDQSSSEKQCGMMTALCLDIFQSPQLMARTKMATNSSSVELQPRGLPGYWLALLSAIFTSLLMMKLIGGAFGRKKRSDDNEEEERFTGIQFTTIRNGVLD